MEKVKRTWYKTPVVIRKPLVLVLGVTIVVVGVILLPLPGPGWLIIFLGLAILGTEFMIAERARIYLVNNGKHLWQQLRQAIAKRRKH
jgi:uncharacterized protein (TIGR02611 family)